MKQKWLRCGLILAIAIAAAITTWPEENPDVQVGSFQQSGEAVTVRIIPDTGCANLVKTERCGETMYCTFLSVPGLTTENEFTVPTDGITEIAFNRPDNTYEPVLAMTDDGDFRCVYLKNDSFILKDAPE